MGGQVFLKVRAVSILDLAALNASCWMFQAPKLHLQYSSQQQLQLFFEILWVKNASVCTTEQEFGETFWL